MGQRSVPVYGQYVGQTEAVKTVEVRARVEGFIERQVVPDGAKELGGLGDRRSHRTRATCRELNHDLGEVGSIAGDRQDGGSRAVHRFMSFALSSGTRVDDQSIAPDRGCCLEFTASEVHRPLQELGIR